MRILFSSRLFYLALIFTFSKLLIPVTVYANHQAHIDEKKKILTEDEYDLKNDIRSPQSLSLYPECHLQKEVFGFHPYWYGSSYKSYDFHALSNIDYFAFHLQPETGELSATDLWLTTPMVDMALSNNTIVGLTITNFGESKNRIFLNNIKAQEKLIRNLNHYLAKRKATSITIDFEGIAHSEKDNLTQFIIRLKKDLSAHITNLKVNMTLPAIDWHHVYDVRKLKSYINRFILMAYDYHNAQSRYAGPVSPLKSSKVWSKHSVEHSVEKYIKHGIPKHQLLLAVAYYGEMWQTKSENIPSKSLKYLGALPYRNLKKGRTLIESAWDKASQSSYLIDKKRQGINQIWIENTKSLEQKYDWVLKNNLAGIAIFALGYDNSHDELWQLIRKKFSVCRTKNN